MQTYRCQLGKYHGQVVYWTWKTILAPEPQAPELAITTKANLIFDASILIGRIATSKILIL